MMEWKSRLVRLAVPMTCALAVAALMPGFHDAAAQAVVLDEYQIQQAAGRFDNSNGNVNSGFKAANIALLAGGGAYVIASPAKPITDVATSAAVPLSQFSEFAEETGLSGTLQKSGDNTALIPTDDALAQMDPTLLQPENRDRLATMLRSHILVGRYTIAQLKDAARQAGAAGRKFHTLAGNDVTATVKDDILYMNGVSMKDSSDLNASNGIVHPISAILPQG
jgi:uncharacterized surface protein with fasciclin (FAS1) repeats